MGSNAGPGASAETVAVHGRSETRGSHDDYGRAGFQSCGERSRSDLAETADQDDATIAGSHERTVGHAVDPGDRIHS